jgi:hypothetical protein|eukprot:COSAG06_NODE_1808_length_8345_cov_31.960102_6_plen_405_part_00
MAEYEALRRDAKSLPELSEKGGFDRFRSTGAQSAKQSFESDLAETMGQLTFAPSSERAGDEKPARGGSAKARARKPPARQGRRAGKTAPAAAERQKRPPRMGAKAEGMGATYDRERTPEGVHPQPKLTGWESWQLTQVRDDGEVVCAATSFDPPWRATEDKEGATISQHPGYHHSAVGHMSASEIRNERARRRLDIASGKKIVPVLAAATAPKGPAERRSEFMKMDFTNKLLDKNPAYLHAKVGAMSPAQMREQRAKMPDWETRHAVGGDDAVQTAAQNRAQLNMTATHWRKPGNRGAAMAASQRVNFFQFENRPDFTFMPHPGPVMVSKPVAGLTPDQLREERAHRKVLNAEEEAAKQDFLKGGGAKDMVDLTRSGRVRLKQERGWRGPSPNPKPVFVEDMTV